LIFKDNQYTHREGEEKEEGFTSCTPSKDFKKFSILVWFLFLGDSIEEEAAAKGMGFPFWRISAHSDLVALNNALDMHYI
jgi:hypothetical protein